MILRRASEFVSDFLFKEWDKMPFFGFTVVGVAKDVKQGGVDQKTRTEVYFFLDQTLNMRSFRAGIGGAMNVVLRTNLPLASLAPTVERIVHETDPSVPIVRFREMETVFADSIQR